MSELGIAFAGVILGGLVTGGVTYFVQSRIEERKYKQHQKELMNEELLGPLGAEVGYIKTQVEKGVIPYFHEGRIPTEGLDGLIRKYQFNLIPEDLQSKMKELRMQVEFYETLYKGARGSLEAIVRSKSKMITGEDAFDWMIREFSKNIVINNFNLTNVILSGKPIEDFSISTHSLAGIEKDALSHSGSGHGKKISFEQVFRLYQEINDVAQGDTNFDINLHNFRVTRDTLLKIIKETNEATVDYIKLDFISN